MKEKLEEKEKIKKKKKSRYVEKIKDIDSSFDVLQDLLNDLLRMFALPAIDKAAYMKMAEAKLETRVYKSANEKQLWKIRQIYFFRANAVRSAVSNLLDEFQKRDEKSRKIDQLVPLLDTIQEQLLTIQKHSKNSFSLRDREFNETQEIFDEKERLLKAQEALGRKGGLKDDQTAKKMKELKSMQDEAIHSNILAIEAMEAAMEALENLEGAAGLKELLLSYYRRYSALFIIVGGLMGGVFLMTLSTVIYKKVIPLFSPPVLELEPQEEPPVSTEGGETTEDASLFSETIEEAELTPDEKFRMAMIESTPFVPNCLNNYVILAGDDLTESASIKEAKYYLSQKKFPTEGKDAVQIIRVRDELELEAALKNGAINSPYCVKGKLFLPKETGFDLGRFPVYLPYGVDPQDQDSQSMMKEQLNYTKRRLRIPGVLLLPRIFPGKKTGEEKGEDNEAYRQAVREYLENFRKVFLKQREENFKP